MGIVGCDRKGCDRIMCNTYVDVNGIGYICSDCQSEFKEYLKEKEIVAETEGEIKKALKKFMKTDKDKFTKGKTIDVDNFFREYRRND